MSPEPRIPPIKSETEIRKARKDKNFIQKCKNFIYEIKYNIDRDNFDLDKVRKLNFILGILLMPKRVQNPKKHERVKLLEADKSLMDDLVYIINTLKNLDIINNLRSTHMADNGAMTEIIELKDFIDRFPMPIK